MRLIINSRQWHKKLAPKELSSNTLGFHINNPTTIIIIKNSKLKATNEMSARNSQWEPMGATVVDENI